MYKITTMLSRILTIAFVCVAFLDAGAMSDIEHMSNFLKVKEAPGYSGGNIATFSTIEKDKSIELPCVLVADSAYDQTFKKIFSDGNDFYGIDGKARLMSFLNSLFYPNAGDDDFRIKDLKYISNEVQRLGEQNQLGLLRFDIACECRCWKGNQEEEEVKVFDVEMQTAHERSFIDRLLTYGSALKVSNPNNHVIVLAFLNYKGNKHPHSQRRTMQFFVDEYGNPGEPIRNFHDDYCIDLSYEITALNENTDIIIDGKTIGIAGREWLKLLSLRQWATYYGNKYLIPRYEDVTLAVASALELLSTINQMQLIKYVNEEKSAKGMMQTARDEGREEGIIARNKVSIQTILGLNSTMESSAISSIMGVPKEFVDLVLVIKSSIETYLTECNRRGTEASNEEFIHFFYESNPEQLHIPEEELYKAITYIHGK